MAESVFRAYDRAGGAEAEKEVMREVLLIDLNELEARLTIRERDCWAVYFVKLFDNRLLAITRKTMFDRPGGNELSEVAKTVTLDNFHEELSDWPAVAIWAVKGLWGVPLEYGVNDASISIRSDRLQSHAKSG